MLQTVLVRSGTRRGAAGVAAVALALCASPSLVGAGAADVGEAKPNAAPKGGPVAGTSIIGGGVADGSRWPFTVAILREGRLHCGGSVIAPTKVLTAAHCLLGYRLADMRVVTGRTRLADTSSGQSVAVADGVVHPDYADTFEHDLGVITLAVATSAAPIALPTPEEAAAFTATGHQLRVSGWGARNPLGGTLAKVLMRTTEKVRRNRRCKRVYRSVFSGRSMICAFGRRLRRYRRISIHTTGCSGDSGGALVGDGPAGPVAIGTVSYGGFICGYGATPTVYARVSDALGFIRAQL
jgi:trypsin